MFISLEIKPPAQAEEFFQTRRLSGSGAETELPQSSGALGPLFARRYQAVRSDPSGRREKIDRYVATNEAHGYIVECFGREGRLADVEKACATFLKTFQPIN
ncbi:MAG: hypothetical protein HY925_02470 [Elusimicrobia bacterium]|nr:hypothetical protein [Elusimicrobiota bacterium]